MLSITEPDRWLGVEIRHLAALQAVAEHRSFGRAADALGYTQSAVSQQIATLERAVGATLVERPGGRRPVSLTEPGRRLVAHAEVIVARLRAAQADLAALADGLAGSLRVATFQSVGARVLPRVLVRFREAWPGITVTMIELESGEELEGFLERGEVDLSFVMPPVTSDVIAHEELLLDPYVLVTPAGSDVPATLDHLASSPLVSYRSCPSTLQLEAHLQMRGVTPNIVFRSDDNGALQGMVAAGMGLAVVPLLAVDQSSSETQVRRLEFDIPPRVIAVGWHRDRYRSPAVECFVECAKQACAELAEQHMVPHGGAAVPVLQAVAG